jgi:hypothetical protein
MAAKLPSIFGGDMEASYAAFVNPFVGKWSETRSEHNVIDHEGAVERAPKSESRLSGFTMVQSTS